MTLPLPRRFVDRILAGHAGLGVAAAALLYILCVTGTLMVFNQEIVRWEQPDVPEIAPGASVDANKVARNAITGNDEATSRDLTVLLPTKGMPRFAAFVGHEGRYATADGELKDRLDQPWFHFLEGLHFYLTLPVTWGLILVGSLGAIMTALVISGLLAHPRMFRDAFRLRLGNKRLVRETDTHNRIGLWGTPFLLIVAFTGAALGLSVGIADISSLLGSDNNRDRFFAAIFGAEPEVNQAEAPLPDIDKAIAALGQRHPSLQPWTVNIHDPGTQGQEAKILAKHPKRLIFGDYHHFDTQGELTYNQGLSDGAIGQQTYASLYTLHFGSFGGLPVKLAYGILGLLASVLIATGGNIWLIKRRQSRSAHPFLERAWLAVVWGSPAMLGVTLLVAVGTPAGTNWLIGIFWGGLVACLVATTCLPRPDWRAWYRVLTAVTLALATGLHFGYHGFWLPMHAVMISLMLITGAAILTLLAGVEWRGAKKATEHNT